MSLTTEEITVVSGQALPTPPKKETPAVLSGFVDFWQGLKRHELWLNLAWEDLVQSFYRTKLGLLWVPLAFLLRVSIFVVIFRQLVDSESADRVVLYITIGFLIWEVLITGLTDGLSLFTSNGNWIQASSMPFSIFSFQYSFLEMGEPIGGFQTCLFYVYIHPCSDETLGLLESVKSFK